MKKAGFYSGILTVTALMLLASCDKIDNPVPEGNNTIDTAGFNFGVNNDTTKHVLLEEFTGHKCPNCPGAAYNARITQDNFATAGKELIIVSIHSGTLAETENNPDSSFITDFRTAAGDVYANAASLDPLPYVPLGMINRREYNTYIKLDAIDWQPAATVAFGTPLEAKMQMIANYNASTREISMGVQTEFLANKSGNYNLIIYVVEDSIVDWQVNGANGDPTYPLGQDIDYYMHRHVLRDNVIASSAWGALVATNPATGQKFVNAYSYNLNSNWDENHIYLVAYVYDDATKEILQVIEHKLIE